MGISNDGSIFNVLQSLIFRMDSPEQKIMIPPTIESSTNKVSEKKEPDKYLATR